jgi:hypothetical protein
MDPTKYLVHACLEGPESGIYYRGKGTITDNQSIVIALPEYVCHIGTNFNVQITPIYNGTRRLPYEVGEVNDNRFQVFGENGSFYWVVFAERNSLEVEPSQNSVNILGYGPYTFTIPNKMT